MRAEIAKFGKDHAAQESLRAEVALIDEGPTLGPTDVIERSGLRKIAGRSLQIHLESHAVTAGDVWVFDPATRVLLAGDLVTLPAPFFESACPVRWRESLAGLGKTPSQWLVPGHGAPMRKKELEAYSKAFSGLLACASSNSPKNACIDAWILDASVLIASRDVSYARTLIDYYVENFLRNPSDQVRKLCPGETKEPTISNFKGTDRLTLPRKDS